MGPPFLGGNSGKAGSDMNILKTHLLRTAILSGLVLPAMWPTPARAAPGAFDLSSPANGAWCTATCTFSWQAAASAATYDLYLDGAIKKAAIAAASSPSYALANSEAIADGWHTWYIVARDSGGATTQSASTWSVRVDSTPPAGFTLTAPLADAWVPSSPVTFSWTPSSDAQSGLDHYEIWINGVAASTAVLSSATTAAVPLPQTTLYTDSVAAGCSQWVGSGDWACTTNHGMPSLSWGGGCCDDNRSGSTILTTPLDLSGAGQVTLQFQYSSNTASTAYYRARGSDDNGATWSNVFTVSQGNIGWTTATANLPMAGTANARIEFMASDAAWTNGWNVQYVAVQGILGGIYASQVVAVDVAGNRTTASQNFHYDLPPVPFDLVSPANGVWTANTTPTFAWNATTASGPGIAEYQVWIDGNLTVDNILASAATAAAPSALADGNHTWQVYAVDAAGAVRPSRQTYSIGIDTTPPAAFSLYSPADQITSTIPTPTLCWNATSDAGSGLDHYQLMIDGALNRDGITDICGTPAASLAEGAHTWSVKAIDGVGNSRAATETWTIRIDFNPPAGFVLLTPGNGTMVDTSTPTFTWGASSDTVSGLSHYELRIDGVCVACSIPSTSTTHTLTAPLVGGSHTWSVTAVDGVAGSTTATGAPWRFTAQVFAPESGPEQAPESGPEPGSEPALEPGPEAGREPSPEPAPEPAHDASVDAVIDAPVDSVADGPTATATSTSTSTATGTLTRTDTGTATSTSTVSTTATGTSVIAEPRADGAVMVGADAPVVVADAGTSDTVGARDGRLIDSLLSAADALAATPDTDASTGGNVPDGGLGSADALVGNALDAKVAASDSGRSGSVDGSRFDAGAAGKSGTSGCGCTVGGAVIHSRQWSIALLGLVLAWRLRRRRSTSVEA